MKTASQRRLKNRPRLPRTLDDRVLLFLSLGGAVSLLLQLTEFTYKSATVHATVEDSVCLVYWGGDADFRESAMWFVCPFPPQVQDPALITSLSPGPAENGLRWHGSQLRGSWISPRVRIQSDSGGIVLPFAWFWPALGVAVLIKLWFRIPAQSYALRCAACGYDLRGAASDICKACGTPIMRTPRPAPPE